MVNENGEKIKERTNSRWNYLWYKEVSAHHLQFC